MKVKPYIRALEPEAFLSVVELKKITDLADVVKQKIFLSKKRKNDPQGLLTAVDIHFTDNGADLWIKSYHPDSPDKIIIETLPIEKTFKEENYV